MFYDDELLRLQKMMEKCYIRTQLVDPATPMVEWLDHGMVRLFGAGESQRTMYDLFPGMTQATVYRLPDMYLCRYFFFLLPFCEKPTVLLIGPFLSMPMTHQMALELSEKMRANPHQAREVEMFYTSLPVVQDEHVLQAAITVFGEYIWSGDENFTFEDLNIEVSPLFSVTAENRVVDSESLDIELMEKRYAIENELMDAVAQGSIHKAESILKRFVGAPLESRAPDRLRNYKNYSIILNTLMRKAAERGGVHPVHLDRVSSDIAHRIEGLRAVEEHDELIQGMIIAYCRLVKRHSMKNVSPLVQKAMVYIENDLTGDLSLSTVAKMNNVSPGYLSGLFKKERGQTFTAYVNGRRIHWAKHLLRTTNLQIQTIAQHCGILDFHYFCRVFKNATGLTPTEYRSKHIYE